jgi:hypothetical protein
MFSLEEISSWSLDEIRFHIRELLLKGQRFSVTPTEGGWVARIEDTGGTRLWEHSGWDERILLLDAFGWLWLRQQARPSPDSPWNRRNPLTQKSLELQLPPIPDPEDVDPEEVLAVYGLRKKTI